METLKEGNSFEYESSNLAGLCHKTACKLQERSIKPDLMLTRN
jgi:hypothetical protein